MGQGIGTPPTVYSRLSELETSGWICTGPDPHDGRVKKLHLTARARQCFTRMSRELAGLMKPSRR